LVWKLIEGREVDGDDLSVFLGFGVFGFELVLKDIYKIREGRIIKIKTRSIN
jgi:hypothetical protein